jgi:prepilin peptidase dependent protein B
MLTLKMKQQGFTLTELLVTLVINAVLFAALMSIFLANLTHYRKAINQDRLYQQLQSAMNLMANDIRRAGYWSNAQNDIGLHQNNNPFMSASTDLSINGSGDCILFTYDRNGTGTLPSISSTIDDDRYGYRVTNQILQVRPPGAQFACSASSSNWDNLTDSNVLRITNLNFSPNHITITTGPGSRGITIRNVTISITGQLASDASISKTLTQQVRIQNDKFIA